MAEEIEKFDPATLMQGVKDRIKATFVSLIPDAQWDQMVKREIDSYFESRDQNHYNYNRTISDFTYTVNEVLRKEAEKKIQELLKSPDFQVKWVGNAVEAPEFFRNAIMKRAPEIFEQAVGNAIAGTLQNMRR